MIELLAHSISDNDIKDDESATKNEEDVYLKKKLKENKITKEAIEQYLTVYNKILKKNNLK